MKMFKPASRAKHLVLSKCKTKQYFYNLKKLLMILRLKNYIYFFKKYRKV